MAKSKLINGIPVSDKTPPTAYPLKITLSGPIATELRRISKNLNVFPKVIVDEALREYLKKKYGVTV